MAYDSLGYIPNDDECARELGYSDYNDYLEEMQRKEYDEMQRKEYEKLAYKEYE